MPFFRPEAKAHLFRWREARAGGGLFVLGGWWLIGPGRLLTLPAIACMIAGLALIWLGIQRARFRSAGQGPGTVEVDEGQIAYFGPLTGGAVALREISRLSLDRAQHPAHWRLDQPGLAPVMIPVNAAGAEALFDAFATLPGLRTERMLAALQSQNKHPIVIWQRDSAISAQLSLH